MGGDSVRTEEDSISDLDFQRSASRCSCFRDDISINGGDSEGLVPKQLAKFSDCGSDWGKSEKAFREILQSYDRLQERISSLKHAKSKILSYTPGAWLERANGVKLSNFDVPKTTSIILVGPKGSGKSSLINRISRVIENDQFSPERAQVSYNSSEEGGTFFLQEYMIPRASVAFCLYDTRGLCQNSSDNINMIKHWITRGVRRGELVAWKSDSSSLKELLKRKAHAYNYMHSETRKVDFVIFVVNGVDVLKSMVGNDATERSYTQMISTVFKCPYLSFKDDKPAVVMTHGDLLSLAERARVRVFLGEQLSIPPDKQIFDIPELDVNPETHDLATELVICDLLRHSLEHADKNLKIFPSRNCMMNKVRGILRLAILSLLIMLAAIGVAAMISGGRAFMEFRAGAEHGQLTQRWTSHGHSIGSCGGKPQPAVEWHKIRHLWLDID